MAREEMTEEEEDKYVKQGAWVGLLLLPFVLLCFCGIFAATPGGQSALYALIIQFSRDGIPYVESPLAYTRGMVGVAKASCALEKQNPRPTDYQASQDTLEEEFTMYLTLYKDYWGDWKKSGADAGDYSPPNEVPGSLQRARSKYCR